MPSDRMSLLTCCLWTNGAYSSRPYWIFKINVKLFFYAGSLWSSREEGRDLEPRANQSPPSVARCACQSEPAPRRPSMAAEPNNTARATMAPRALSSASHRASLYFLLDGLVKTPSTRPPLLSDDERQTSTISPSRLFVFRKSASLESSCNLYPQIAECVVRAFWIPAL